MMFSFFRWAGLFIALTVHQGQSVVAQEVEEGGQVIQVMVIGVTHFDDPGCDLVDTKAADVLSAVRQSELEALAEALAKFEPTVVAIEKTAQAPDYDVKEYLQFTRSQLLSQRNENVQIGFRLANKVGLDIVYGVDEQPSESEPNYFPFDKVQGHVEKIGKSAAFGQYFSKLQASVEAAITDYASLSIPEALLAINRKGSLLSSTDYFFEIMKFDRGETQPGAELYAYYMMRNAKIFGKLMAVSTPGDRVVLVYGAGHKRWLEQLLENAPGFEVVSAVPYLEDASIRSKH